jgi:serine/threonine protein kinase
LDIPINLEGLFTTTEFNIYRQINISDRCVPSQGWKIHVSCTMMNFTEILSIVFAVASEYKVTLKYIKDTKMLKRYLSADTPPDDMGKFITLYPHNDHEFIDLLNVLYERLNNFDGPYILSDRRYLNCKVLYYRYGALTRNDGLLESPNGELFIDDKSYFNIPTFVASPSIPELDSEKTTTLGIKYDVSSIIHYSSAGNVYTANDKNGLNYILKEGRAFVIGSLNEYRIDNLSRESNIIKKLNACKFSYLSTPDLVDEFNELENRYIVETKLTGIKLEQLSAGINKPKSYAQIKNLFLRIIYALNELHDAGIVLRDVSPANILIDDFETNLPKIKIIDFGSSMQRTEYYFSESGLTDGFRDNRFSSYSDTSSDWHQVGYLFMSYLSSSNNLLKIDKSGEYSWNNFIATSRLTNVDESIVQLIYSLINYPDNWNDHLSSFKQANENNEKIIHSTDDILKKLTTTIEKIKLQENKLTSSYLSTKSQYFGGLSNANITMLVDYLDKDEQIDTTIRWIKYYPDMSVNTGVLGFGILLIESMRKLKKKDTVCKLIHEVNKRIETTTLNDFNNKLGISNGMLGISLFKLLEYNKMNDFQSLKDGYTIIEELAGQIVWQDNGMIDFPINSDGKIYSPYISNGLSGYILLLGTYALNPNVKLTSNLFKILKSGIATLNKCTWAKHGGLLSGVAGIGFVLKFLKAHFNLQNDNLTLIDLTISSYIRENVSVMGSFPSSDFTHSSISFEDGALGILFYSNYNGSEDWLCTYLDKTLNIETIH